MGSYGDGCTMTPNPSNSKTCQRNQMQPVEKDLPLEVEEVEKV